MKLFSQRSLIAIILGALLLVTLPWAVALIPMSGGHSENSPDGKYRIHVSTRLDPRPNVLYSLTMTDLSTSETVRDMELRLSAKETAKPLRRGPRTIHWSSDSTYAEFQLVDKQVLRVYTP
jgi:hypothetical protein